MTGTPDLDRFTSRRSTVYAPGGIVATSQPLAAEAGLSILRDGGNAFDAAVGTAAALNVVEPTSTGLGGDVFALYRTSDGSVGAMRSCGPAPSEATRERVANAVSGAGTSPSNATMPDRGPHTVTVPGTARGWETTLRRFGAFDLSRVLQPAIHYALNGFPVSEVVAEQWHHGEALFDDENARETYLKSGRAPTVGEWMEIPRLGETLQTIAEKGSEVVYEGEIATDIVDAVREKGGFLTRKDLEHFEPEFIDPISTTYRGSEVFQLPPNNQGMIVLEALNIAEELDAGSHAPGSPEEVHYFAEALKLAFHDGHHYITDPEYVDVPELHSKSYAADRAKQISETASSKISIGSFDGETADTVLVTTADDRGNVVSYINSRFSGFGSGIVAGESGIALQNRGSSFSLDPDAPNRLEPGKRPFHTLIPGLLKLDSDDWAAFGVMGGYMQPQGQLQVLANILDHDQPLQAALDRPRWRYWQNGDLAVEARMDDRLLSKLPRRGHNLRIQEPGLFGGAQIARFDDGTLSGATEPRKDGTVAGF